MNGLLVLRFNCSVNVSTGDDAVLTVVPAEVLENAAPGSVLDFKVNVACGLAREVEPTNVRSGIAFETKLNCRHPVCPLALTQ